MFCRKYRKPATDTVAARRPPATPSKPSSARNSWVGPSRTQPASHLRVELLRARQELVERVHVSLSGSHDDVRVCALTVDDPPPLL